MDAIAATAGNESQCRQQSAEEYPWLLQHQCSRESVVQTFSGPRQLGLVTVMCAAATGCTALTVALATIPREILHSNLKLGDLITQPIHLLPPHWTVFVSVLASSYMQPILLEAGHSRMQVVHSG